MARYEWYHEGRVPLHTLRADIEYGTTEAHTTYGAIGVKCWIFKGEVLPQRDRAARLRDADRGCQTMLAPKKSQVPQAAEGHACAASPRARPTCRFGDFGLQALVAAAWSPRARSRRRASRSPATSSAAASSTSASSRTSRSRRSRPRPAWVTARAAPRGGWRSCGPGRVMYELEGVDRDAGARGVPPGRAQAVGPDAVHRAGGGAVKGVAGEGPARATIPTELRAHAAQAARRICSSTGSRRTPTSSRTRC